MANILSSADLRAFDTSLMSAVEEGSKTGSITPIIKQELKYTILTRRLNEGKGEIVLEEERPKGKRELTTEERRKKERRKEQNRRAAARCREKKKKCSELVLQEFINEQNEKKQLEQEVESLKKQKLELQRIIDGHDCFNCPSQRSFTPTPTNTPPYDVTTTFTYPACTVPSPHVAEVDFNRDTTTPFSCGDPYDDVFNKVGISQYMYPSAPDMTSQKETCAASQFDPDEILLPDDFQLYQCSNMEFQMDGGRQSISEYIDNGFMPQ